MKLEDWLIINQMSNAVMALNSVFCETPENSTQGEYSEAELNVIVEGIAKNCPGKMPLEDAIEVLTKALKIKEANESDMP